MPDDSSDLVWRRRSAAPPRERQGLTLDRIVLAAVRLADAEGLDAVSMARVAKALDFTTMALYRHIPSKEVLLRLMADEAVGMPPAPLDQPGPDWRAALLRWSEELLPILGNHPWVMQLLVSGEPALPTQLAWLDRGLQALADTPLPERTKTEILLVLNGLVFWEARLRTDVGPPESQTAFVAHITEGDGLPALRRAFEAQALDPPASPGANVALDLGLKLLLDGIETLITTHAAPQSHDSQPP